jgi:hypothetical protein
MGTLAEFNMNAEQCFRMAEATRDRDLKASWARLAETWLRLAEQETHRKPPANWRDRHRPAGPHHRTAA